MDGGFTEEIGFPLEIGFPGPLKLSEKTDSQRKNGFAVNLLIGSQQRIGRGAEKQVLSDNLIVDSHGSMVQVLEKKPFGVIMFYLKS